MPTNTASRAKLPIMIAAWLLVAVIALIGSGLTGTAQAQASNDSIPSLTLDSHQPGQLVITWQAPASAPTDYRVSWANADLNWLSWKDANEPQRANEYPLADVTTITLSDLTPGDTYKVQMRSRYYNADRTVRESSGPWTDVITQRVKNNPPAAPTSLTASQVTHESLTLTWHNPQDSTITGYQILRGTEANSLFTIEDNTGSASASYTDSTVEPETTYHYAVQALSQDGNGARAVTSGTTPAEPDDTVQNDPPAVPTGLAASQVSHDSLTLTWNNPQDANITGYRVMRGTDAGSLATLANPQSDSTSYTDATVEPETTYHYAVLALSQDGNSVQSDAIGATTPAAPKKKDPPPQRVGARQVTTTDIWTATLTPAALGGESFGCTFSCSNATVLTDNDFTYDSTDYTVTNLYIISNGNLRITLDTDITTATGADLSLVVGTTTFAFASADTATARYRVWESTSLSWTAGTDVAVKLTATANAAPTVANAIPNQSATANTAFSYQFPADTFNDADTGDTLTYTATKGDDSALPPWLMFDANTRTFSGTPDTGSIIRVKIKASDGTDSITDEFDIIVITADIWTATLTVATVFSNLGCNATSCPTALTDDNFTYDSTNYTVEALYLEPNGDLTLIFDSRFTVSTREDLTLVIENIYLPLVNADPSLRSVSWHDTGFSWTLGNDVSVKLVSINNAPTVANSIPNQSATANTAFSYTFPANTFNDTDTGDTLTYTTTKADGAVLPTWLAFDSATRIFSGTPTAAETVSLKVTASDGTASASDEFDIVVRAADNTAPTVTSIERQDPTEPLTNSDTPTWRVTFSEAVKNVDTTDFTIAGTTAAPTVTPVTNVTGGYDVTPTGGDIASLTGTITLAFASAQNIADTADNELTATAPTGINEPTFEMDNTVPTFVSGTANGTLIVMTFSEELDPNSLPPASAFNISTDSNVMANSVSIEGAMVTLTVTPAIIVNQTVDVNNNAYAGTGTVPLKDTAGNEVQPAAIVGSYRVTNETPIGPPASLRAEAGDGRVRLVWTRPAGISQFIDYQFRHAPGTSVPVGTAWIGITSLEGLTELVQELANGMTHAFEVRAIRDSDVGAAATVSATPMADTCMLDLDDRREVWSATMTVGRDIKTELAQTDAGYRRGIFGSLPQDGNSFMIGGASYTIKDIFTIVRTDGVRRQLFLELVNSRRFTPAVKEALRFHWCSDSSGLADPTPRGYLASNPYQADWSLYTTREIALRLPPNNDATGTPMITGTAVAAQALTASTTGISDPDGLPSAFAYQWKRVDSDGISNPTNIGADSATYTLTDNEVGKKVLVEVSFTDSLSGVESLTSDAYPGTGTVSAAPMRLAVTQREDRPYTFTESDFSNLPGGVVQLTKVIITELPNNGWLARSKIVLLPSGNYQGQSDRIYSRHLPLTLSTDHRRLSLAFFPEDDGNGTPYASLKFKVNDSTTVHTMTINVTPVNDPAYGKVFINGPSQVGYDLTSSTSSMGDRDGIPQDQLNYQWKRYSSDGNTFESDIGVNSRTYTLTTAEEGKKVKVEVSYVDGGGTSEATLSEAFPYITDQTIGESTFQSIMGSAGDTFYDFTAEHGQAFTTGTHPNGYTLSRVVLQSEDAEGDDLAVKICGVNTNGNPNTICTDLNVPGSFTRGLLSFTAPPNTTLDGGRTNYMVVISSTGGDSVRLDATRSGGFDSSALGSGWSIATKTRMNTTEGWQDVNGTRIRIAILGTINP